MRVAPLLPPCLRTLLWCSSGIQRPPGKDAWVQGTFSFVGFKLGSDARACLMVMVIIVKWCNRAPAPFLLSSILN